MPRSRLEPAGFSRCGGGGPISANLRCLVEVACQLPRSPFLDRAIGSELTTSRKLTGGVNAWGFEAALWRTLSIARSKQTSETRALGVVLCLSIERLPSDAR
jgi:hypothetical protein